MDPIADMLIRIKNGQAVRHRQVLMPFSKMRLAIASILRSTGYLTDVDRVKKTAQPGIPTHLPDGQANGDKPREHEYLVLTLKYRGGEGAISGMRMISRQSRRLYVKADGIKPVRSGHGLAIISTSKGILDSRTAKKESLGGEIICEVW